MLYLVSPNYFMCLSPVHQIKLQPYTEEELNNILIIFLPL